MIELAIISQIIVGAVVLSVWTIRYNNATEWRGGDAKSMPEEFATYGLSPWVLGLTRVTKIALAVMILAGIWVTQLAVPASLAMAALMTVAIAMHVKVGDALRKSAPAFTMLVLCLLVAYGYQSAEQVTEVAGG